MDQNYSIRELTEKEFKPLFDKHKKSVFEDVRSYNLADILSDPEQEKNKELGRGLDTQYKLYLGVFDKNDELVGWIWGQQENAPTFYMVNSAVLKEHRRKGLYGALLQRCIKILSEKGFQLIYSRHCATNNDVIIPKLKAGFIISKMEVDDKYGVLVHLHFYTNKDRRKMMGYRSGQLKPDAQIRGVLKII